MSELSHPSYTQLVSLFLEELGEKELLPPFSHDNEIVEWPVRDLVVRFIPHLLQEKAGEALQEPNALIIEADLMLLDLENREVNHDRFLILHQINLISRVTTGIVAFINEEGMLSINKILRLEDLDKEELANQMVQVIEAGERLSELWDHLPEFSEAEKKALLR